MVGTATSPCLPPPARAGNPQMRSPAACGETATATLARRALMHGLAALRLASYLLRGAAGHVDRPL